MSLLATTPSAERERREERGERRANKIACELGERSRYIQRLTSSRCLRLVEVGVCETAGGGMMVMAVEVKRVCSWGFFWIGLGLL